jgi:hypothetical protein
VPFDVYPAFLTPGAWARLNRGREQFLICFSLGCVHHGEVYGEPGADSDRGDARRGVLGQN